MSKSRGHGCKGHMGDCELECVNTVTATVNSRIDTGLVYFKLVF